MAEDVAYRAILDAVEGLRQEVSATRASVGKVHARCDGIREDVHNLSAHVGRQSDAITHMMAQQDKASAAREGILARLDRVEAPLKFARAAGMVAGAVVAFIGGAGAAIWTILQIIAHFRMPPGGS